MKLWERYHTPATVSEAIELLARYQGEARVIAGGTDLLLDIKAGSHPPVKALVDVTAIPELTAIHIQGDQAMLGAAVTHTAITRHAEFAQRATCIVESCGVIGGPQVRNVATIGGNVAHALPAGDGTTALVTLGAQAEVYKGGQRVWVDILEMYRGPGTSLVDPTRELILGFRFDLSQPGEASAFKRIMRPQGVALPVLGCAVWLRLDAARQVVSAARVCIAPVSPTPQRVVAVEQFLQGKTFSEKMLQEAAALAQSELQPRASKYRASAPYRAELVGVLLRHSLAKAWQRAASGEAVPEGVGTQ